MKYCQDGDTILLVLERGEEVVSSLTQFAAEQGITGGYFRGIGAVDDPELSSYNVASKKYTSRELPGEFELVALTGNFSLKEGKPFPHIHAVVSDVNLMCFGGHLNHCRVAATVELFIHKLNLTIEREYNDPIGLFLIK